MKTLLGLSNSKARGMCKRYLLTSYYVDDVTERAPRDDNGNVTLMTQGAQQDFFFHFATYLILLLCFPVNYEVQSRFTSI